MPRSMRIVAFLLSVLMLLSLIGCKQNSTVINSSEAVSSSEPSSPDSNNNSETTPNDTLHNDEEVPAEGETSAGTESTTPEAVSPDEPSSPDANNNSETMPAEVETSDGTPEAFKLSDVQPIIKDGSYQYNPYLLSKEAIRCYDIGFLAFYKDFLTAYMNYETECACPDVEYAQLISMVASYECPFYSGDDLDFSWSANYDYDAQRLNWTYQVDKDTLQERISLVADAMQDFLDLVSPSDDEADKIQTLYHTFCPLMTYDYGRRDSREKIDGCYALLDHTGICVTFSYAFAQILSQTDMDATIAGGEIGGEAHVWNYVCVNGQYYFFDPTFELNYKGGNAFVYYGMNLEERADSGAFADMIRLGRYQDYEFVVAENHLNVH